MDDLLREFLTESNESLATLDQELVKLERNPNDPGLLSNIFRLVHTVKGTCGFLGLPRLERTAHAGENVLGKLRDGELEVTPVAVSLILESLDRIKFLLGALEANGTEPEGSDEELTTRLNAFADGKLVQPATASAPAASEVASSPTPNAEPEREPEPEPVATEAAPMPEAAPVAAVAAIAAAAAASGVPAGPAEAKESAVAAQSIRVNVDLLENLMTMVSELVLTRNQLLQILRSQKDSEFGAPLQRLNHVTSELQEGVMKTRMQPIGSAWGKLPRLIRDLSHELGKKIELEMRGADTELDRQVLELIKDPLTHMVRNSADHGLEPPAARKAVGKPEVGRIMLNAFHEGGHIIIEIADDGRGLALDKIRAKAIANGLCTEAEAAGLTDQQVAQFIFKAGLSTAAKVTNVSGRGVGMDVVKTNIEKIGGTIELKTAAGKGSTFVIKIPLTLAIVSALIVECAGERFAIPQIAVLELVRAAQGAENTIERVKGAPFLRLRNRLLPLVNLKNLLQLNDGAGDTTESFIVVTQVGTNTFGIMVDRVFDTEEIVVKPVAPILRDIPIFSGNTILGDGSVIMILDPNGIASRAGERSTDTVAADSQTTHQVRNDDRATLLIFRAGDHTQKAVPLALVSRLEEVDSKTIELSNGRPVVQYRGKLMPLIAVDGMHQLRSEGQQPILVFADGMRSMGLMVDEILDIVEERLKIELKTDRPGLMGSAIISSKATELIDTQYYLTMAFQDWFGTPAGTGFGELEEAPKKVLLVDDSPFFRNLLGPLLMVAGYDVTTAESADEALVLCEEGKDFDVIVSDIEMPGMNGFDFAAAVRANSRWQATPLLALTSHTSARDLERGRQAGFIDYIAKSDRDGLLGSLSQTISNLTRAA
jgi:two-component system chemotaxis sensor kinase CheA